MFTLVTGYITRYAAVGLASAMLLMFIYFKITISSLESDNLRLQAAVSSLQVDVINADRNTAMCNLALERQTNAVDELKVDYQSNLNKLAEWESRPPEIRYNTIYKTITKYDYSKGDCNETKALILDISNINYADL